MGYTPDPTWADGQSGNTPITAAKLNNIESGILNSDGTNPLSAEAIHDAATFEPVGLSSTTLAAITTIVSTGTSAVAGKLQTPRAINSVLFDGTASVTIADATKAPLAGATFTGPISATNLSGSNTGDQSSVTGNAGTATKLTTPQTINGVAFDGSAPVVVADATKKTLTQVAATATSTGTATAWVHNPYDATLGALTATLPTGAVSQELSIEKVDSTVNTVTIAGSIRGAASTIILALPHETIKFVADSSGSWWPVSGHKTLTSLDGRYPLLTQTTSARLITNAVALTAILPKPWSAS
ncbi:hypothetical protein [Subtercola vilae]|uniref:Uncharacterized protein n=1 Tax=Subtercola vilae TaxID=2056433 RepID=A0A4T2BYR1_9MICO|nr:hypothetical protein [Subtercola vilae]TIH34986.1 hypothetical protein D4765_11880 [Subtercola vilae]